MKKVFLRTVAVCALLLMPAVASAAEGFATANVNMRSGPSTYYPAVTVIPAGDSVEIHGCLSDRPWCDVSFYGGRGWVAGRYVQAAFQSRRVYVEPEYYRLLGIPTVVFEFDSYWDRNYRGRDFYRDRDRWRHDRDWDRERERDGRKWERRQVRERRDWERDRDRERREWEPEYGRDDDRWRRRVESEGYRPDGAEQPRRERRYEGHRTIVDCNSGDVRCE